MAVGMILVAAPIQMIAGDAHGLNTLEHQPAKIAAIEGLWETEKGGTSLNLVGWPDMPPRTVARHGRNHRDKKNFHVVW